MSQNKIVVVGSSNTDMVIKVERVPRPGETILGGEFFSAAGGKGANQAVGAARAGGEVTFIARVGDDMFGAQAIATLKRDGINVDHVTKDPTHPSGVALIFVGADGENSIAVASGANGVLAPADIEKAKDPIAAARIMVVQLEVPLETVQSAVRTAAKHGVKVILNPAPARHLPEDLLHQVAVLTPNETEAELLTGIKVQDELSAGKAAEILRSKGVEMVIITLGARGAWIASDERRELIPGFKVQAVDTTAAGDIFNGALAVAFAESKPLIEAVRLANAAAAISVTRLGAQPSAPSRGEIDRFLTGNHDKNVPGRA